MENVISSDEVNFLCGKETVFEGVEINVSCLELNTENNRLKTQY